MADSTPPLAVEIFDQRFKEYQICREEAARLESSMWQTAAVFGLGSAAGLGFAFARRARSPPASRAPGHGDCDRVRDQCLSRLVAVCQAMVEHSDLEVPAYERA